jgi:DNA/RNA endonuclease YhcR with UshA esterase domain
MRACGTIVVLSLIPFLATAGDQQDKDKPLTPGAAAKKVNQKCTVEMAVKSVGKGKGVYFLNSNEDYNTGDNFTVFINKTGVESLKRAKIEDPASHFKDKTLRVRGLVRLFRGRPEIIVEEADQIKLVEKK